MFPTNLFNSAVNFFKSLNFGLKTDVVRTQFLSCLIVNLVSFGHGISLGWTAPSLLLLSSNETPLNAPISISEGSWLASVNALGGLTGNLILCNLIDIIGRKPSFVIMAIPIVILWIIVYFAKSVEYLYFGRFIGGISGGAAFSVVPIFINEISDVNTRGSYQGFFTITINGGILIGYILSSNLDYHLIPLLVLILPVVYLLLLLYFPETPQHLLRKGKDELALKSFKFYKNFRADSAKCKSDFEELKAMVLSKQHSEKLCFKDFATKPALKAYATGLVLITITQLSGLYSFITYMSNIFVIVGSPLNPDTCTIIMGVVQLLGNISASVFIDRCGRKILLIISSIGLIFGLVTFGTFTYLRQTMAVLTLYSWVPIVLMVFIIFLGNIGVGAVTVICLIEILPTKIRATALSIFMAMISVLIFILLKYFPMMMHSFGISMTMWFFAAATAICLVYLIIFLPETKSKSMDTDEA